jgi:hypothetical protein
LNNFFPTLTSLLFILLAKRYVLTYGLLIISLVDAFGIRFDHDPAGSGFDGRREWKAASRARRRLKRNTPFNGDLFND